MPRSLLETLEPRRLFSVDPVVQAYLDRATAVLDANVTSLKSWASTQTGIDNLNESGRSIWTAAAGFARAASDPAALSAARLLLANIMQDRLADLWSGGNDGWEAWAGTDTYLRFRPLIQSDPARYTPVGYPVNAASADGKYSLDEMCRIVITTSYYAPIDSTSNHVLMNATAAYLANTAFPGQVVKGYNNSTTDFSGTNTLSGVTRGIVTGGPGEYLSPNYGAFNWAELLSVSQLTPSGGNTALATRARVAFETALAMNAAWWMNGTVAGPVGRGYPNTGAWAASSGDSLTWTYYGGDYGEAAGGIANADNTDVKTLGVLASISQFGGTGFSGYIPPTSLLKLTSFSTPFVTQSNFGTNHQYAYNTGLWSSYNESYKGDAFGPYQANWRARTQWTKLPTHDYDPVAWAAHPATNPTANTDGTWTYVDPYTLQTWPLSGSGTYHGSSVFTDMMQHLNTTFQVYNIPPLALAGTPGGTIPARGALIYLPIPKVIATGLEAADGDGWMRPVLSADGHRLYVAYNSVFMAFHSSAPISLGTRNGFQQFYNIYGGAVAGQQADPNSFLQFAVAQETFSPTDFPGTTLQERFANFRTALSARQLPQLIKADTYHPIYRYQDDNATLTSEFSGIERYGDDPKAYTKGVGEEFIAGLGNTSPQLVDYANWPLLRVTDLAGNVLLHQPEDANLTVTVPGEQARYYDFNNWTVSAGPDLGLSAVSNAGGAISLTWKPGLGASSFTVQRSPDAATWTTVATLPAAATSYTDTGLTQRTVYYYRITPNGTALGTSFPVSAMTEYLAPTNLAFTLNSTSQISFTWTNNAALNDGVQLQFSPDGYSQWQWLVNLPASFTSRTVSYTDFTGGERLFYRALAYSNDGPNGTTLLSPPSNVVGTEFSAPNVGRNVSMPRPPTLASASSTAIAFAWQPTATNATSTRVERSIDGVTWTVLTSALPANASTFTDTTVSPGVTYRYRVASASATATSAYSAVLTATAALPNAAPTVATPAAATQTSPTTVALAVLGSDDAGEPGLRYSWAVTAGPGAVTFSANHTNAAKSTTATFTRAGTYTLTATAFDPQGLPVTSSVVVTVAQVASTIAIAPTFPHRLTAGQTRQFTATALDQFGMTYAVQPAFTWSATTGTISSTGLFTAPATAGLSVVSVSAGNAFASVPVSVLNLPAPLAEYSFDDGSTRDSSGNGFDAALAAPATITTSGSTVGGVVTPGLFPSTGGAVIGNPAALNFSGAITLSAWVRPTSTSGTQTVIGHGNASNPNAEVFLRTNGAAYQVGAWNGSTAMASATLPTGDLNTWVFLTGTYDPVSQRWTLYRNGTQAAQSSATTLGSIPVNANWAIGENSNNSRNFLGTLDEVRLFNTALSASQVAILYDVYLSPTIATPATATLASVNTAALSVLGAYRLGESALTYRWHVLGTAPGSVAFSANNTNAAKASTATFSAPGMYRLAVTATNASGNATVSYVNVTVPSPAAPGAVVLAPASDTGIPGDNLTRLNNASAASRLTFNVTGTTPGATVRLYAGNTLLASTVATASTTTLTTDGVNALPDGPVAFTATQSALGIESAASAPLTVALDTTAPTLVVPAPVSSPVASLALNFSESVTGLSLGALTLTRDAAAVPLTVANTPTSSAVPNLNAVTSRPGSYVFTVSAAGITDLAGNPLSPVAPTFWLNTTLIATAADDAIALHFTSPTAAIVTVNTDAPYTLDLTPFPSLTVASAGSDTLVVSGASPVVPLRLSGGLALTAAPAIGSLTVTAAGSLVTASAFTAGSVSVESGATLRLTSPAYAASVFSALSVAPAAVFDVGQSTVVYRNAAGHVPALRALLASGRVASSSAVPFSAVSLFLNDSGFGFPNYTTYAGVPALTSADLLLRHTYRGDTDLNGRLDARDFSSLLSGLSNARTTWNHGDLDHSGLVDPADLALFPAEYASLPALSDGTPPPPSVPARPGPSPAPTASPTRSLLLRSPLPTSLSPRQRLRVTVELRDAEGLALRTPGVPITLTLAGSTYTATTDRRGRASFILRAPSSPGNVAATLTAPEAPALNLSLIVRPR